MPDDGTDASSPRQSARKRSWRKRLGAAGERDAARLLAQLGYTVLLRDCRTPYEPDDEVLRRLSLTRDQVGNRSFYYGRGCSVCNNTGYKGRKGIFEYLRVGPQIREMINERKPTLLIRERAREIGMRTMREDGVRNILDGYTSVDEVLRYT